MVEVSSSCTTSRWEGQAVPTGSPTPLRRGDAEVMTSFPVEVTSLLAGGDGV